MPPSGVSRETPAEFNARMRSVGVISRRSRDRVSEGREHPDSGKPDGDLILLARDGHPAQVPS